MQKSYVYIITNIRKTMYYIGVTNNLERRLTEHREGLGLYIHQSIIFII